MDDHHNKPNTNTTPKKNNLSGDSSGNNNNNTFTFGGYVDTSRADKAIWLMKCPLVVSHSLQPQPQPEPPSSPSSFQNYDNNTTINNNNNVAAKVIVSIDPLRAEDNPSPEFTMELASTESGNVPKRYSMEMSKDIVPMSVFSENEQGKVSMEGKILQKFDMRPHDENIESYGKFYRERSCKYMKTRQIQVIDHDTGSLMRPMPVMEKKKIQVKAAEMKRTRRDRAEMEEIMFRLFERQENWTLRQLIQETDQPEQFMKDILKDLCIYNNKGSNQGTYELKPEYRKSTDEPTSS